VKGSVSNLSNLSAQLGVIVIGQDNLDALHKQPPHANKSEKELEKTLRDRVYRWIYAEAQPRSRVIVMFERDVIKWSDKLASLASSIK
jgi:UDP-N-acetylglucosamine 2-epimerase